MAATFRKRSILYAPQVTVLRTRDVRYSSTRYLLIFQLPLHKSFQDARDGTIALVVFATKSSHLHMVRVDALDSL